MTRSNKASSRNGSGTGATAISRGRSHAAPLADPRNAGRSAFSAVRGGLTDAGDDRLIVMAASGDQAAWGTIVERHLSSLVGYAWRLLREPAEAEDIAQEAFIRLLRKAPEWHPGEASLSTWLHRVVTNLCIDRKRRLGRFVIHSFARMEHAPDQGSLEADINRANAVGRALAQLKTRQRVAIALAHYQGFTNPEIAQIMGTSVEAVESLHARARRSLRETLGPIVDDLLEET